MATTAQRLVPPFTKATAHEKVKVAQALWNTRDPQKVVQAYTPNSIWRNRSNFFVGHTSIRQFLQQKWAREESYMLRKELFTFQDNKIAVQFWYEYQDSMDVMKWKRCYGIEHWTFDAEGKMEKRMMSGNDVLIGEDGDGKGRWFEGLNAEDVDGIVIPEGHC
ncbi:MAG: hypothetical protein L6R42_002166 [Xanthoria sp. 1 TBL-2021]|nr:MAG: hypothetical protein L6R42_002166 [Xanthoria sp. 1 TBL-2021]